MSSPDVLPDGLFNVTLAKPSYSLAKPRTNSRYGHSRGSPGPSSLRSEPSGERSPEKRARSQSTLFTPNCHERLSTEREWSIMDETRKQRSLSEVIEAKKRNERQRRKSPSVFKTLPPPPDLSDLIRSKKNKEEAKPDATVKVSGLAGKFGSKPGAKTAWGGVKRAQHNRKASAVLKMLS
eukprot:gene23441-28377_t